MERNLNDPSMLVVTYTSDHNHPWPTHRINSLAGSIRPPPAKSASPSRMNELSPDCNTCNSPLSGDIDDGPSASPLSHDTLQDDDLTVCQDFDAANFNATSPTFSTTARPLRTHNPVNAGMSTLRASNVVKPDPELVDGGHVLSALSTTSAPAMSDRVVNKGASRDSGPLQAPFGADLGVMGSTFSPSSAPWMVYNGSSVGAGFMASQASSLDCDVTSLTAEASGCSTALTSLRAAKPEDTATRMSPTGASEQRGRDDTSSCMEEEAQLFDTLLSEMLEEVQRQNRATVGEDDEALLFNWSNNINFLSQVNHLVQ